MEEVINYPTTPTRVATLPCETYKLLLTLTATQFRKSGVIVDKNTAIRFFGTRGRREFGRALYSGRVANDSDPVAWVHGRAG